MSPSISPSLTRYIFSPPILNRWGSFHLILRHWLFHVDGLSEQPQAYSVHCWWYGQGRPKYIDDSWNLFVNDDRLCYRSSRRSTSLLHRHRHCHNISEFYTKFRDCDDATDNTSSLCLSLNVETLSMPMTQNKTSAIAKLCWEHSCRRWCSMRSTKFFIWIWRVTDVSPDRTNFMLICGCWYQGFPDSLLRMVSCMVHNE